MNTDLRSLEIIDFNAHNHLPIHIIGMGATGSRVYEQLFCMGARNIHCYDFDEVEEHNIHNQLWTQGDVGDSKVMAAAMWTAYKMGYGPEGVCAYMADGTYVGPRVQDYPDLHFHNTTVTQESAAQMNGIVFLLTDTFKSRETILQGVVDGEKSPLVIETRLGTRFNEVRSIDPLNPKDVKAFMDSLGDDDAPDAEVSACGTKINCALSAIGAANIACWALVNFLTKQIPQARINNNYQPVIQQGSQEL